MSKIARSLGKHTNLQLQPNIRSVRKCVSRMKNVGKPANLSDDTLMRGGGGAAFFSAPLGGPKEVTNISTISSRNISQHPAQPGWRQFDVPSTTVNTQKTEVSTLKTHQNHLGLKRTVTVSYGTKSHIHSTSLRFLSLRCILILSSNLGSQIITLQAFEINACMRFLN
jgi:hypothetical protein